LIIINIYQTHQSLSGRSPGDEEMNRVTAFAAASILIALMMSFIPSDLDRAEALQIIPSVFIRISEESYKADVNPDSDGLIEINGTASFTGIWPEGVTEIVVSLEGDASGWDVDTLDDITLTPSNKEKEFSTNLHVPQGTSSDHQGTVIIKGNWTTDIDEVAKDVISDSAVIDIDQYYDYSISTENLKGTVNAGEGIGFELTIFNEGNGHDRIRILILDHINHTDEGLAIRVSQDKFQISEKSNRTLSLTINTTNVTTVGYHSILVCIISAQAESLGYQPEMKELELNLTVEPAGSNYNDPEGEETPFIGVPIILLALGVTLMIISFSRRKEMV
jgi:hypothetical protein